jgi:DNA (cytosine-5)-methyltransferase 1
MKRPRLLDLFCGAGGASRGYTDAGFDVSGVDIKLHNRYFGRAFGYDKDAGNCLLQADISAWDEETFRVIARNFDAIHASPPCQFGTALRHAPGARHHVNLIPHTRRLLEASGLPWIIENVDADAVRPFMPDATLLCGSMFGLGVEDGGRRFHLERHRLFLTNWPLQAPRQCVHHAPTIGVYGGHARNRGASSGGRGTADAWTRGHLLTASAAMGIDWMTLGELSEAIPPAYTRWVGGRLMERL